MSPTCFYSVPCWWLNLYCTSKNEPVPTKKSVKTSDFIHLFVHEEVFLECLLCAMLRVSAGNKMENKNSEFLFSWNFIA